MVIRKYGHYGVGIDLDGVLVCLCVYKKGAAEVVWRLALAQATTVVPSAGP